MLKQNLVNEKQSFRQSKKKTPAQVRWSGSKSIPGRQFRNFFSLHIKLPLKFRQKWVSFEQSSNSSIHSLMSLKNC